MYNKGILIFSIILTSLSIIAQQSSEFIRLKEKYPQEINVNTYISEVITFDVKDDKPYITHQITQERIYLHNVLGLDNSENVTYSQFKKLKKIQAYTLQSNGKDYKRIEVKNFEDKHQFSNAIFHDDVVTRTFQFPNIKQGDKTYLTYTHEFEIPEMIDKIMIAEYYNTEKYEIQIIVNNQLNIDYKTFFLDKIKYDFKKTEEKKYTKYTWTISDLPKINMLSGAPSIMYFAPQIIPYLTTSNINKQPKTYLTDIEHLHKFYYNFIQKLNKEDSLKLKPKVDSILQNTTDELEKVKKIHYWVKENIKYIAFESGFQGYIPRDANYIYEKRYGDCKDMASIINHMCRLANIDSVYLVWIGSNTLPYKIEELHTPSIHNHMIAAYKHNNKIYYLDATDSYTTWGLPSQFTIGKQGLFHISSNTYEIHTIPETPADKSIRKILIQAQIKNDSVIGIANETLSGYIKSNHFSAVEALNGKEYFNYLRNYTELGNNKYYLNKYEAAHEKQKDSLTQLSYNFKILNYFTKIGNTIYINPFLKKFGAINDPDTDCGFDYYFQANNILDVEVKLAIPEDYEIKYTPTNQVLKFQNLTFKTEINSTQKAIKLRYIYETNQMIVPANDRKKFVDFEKDIQRIISQQIILNKK